MSLRAVQPGDRYLICSDGFSDFAAAEAICRALADGTDVTQTANDLVALAYPAGAPDNVTVIVVDVPDGTWAARDGSTLVLEVAAELAGQASPFCVSSAQGQAADSSR